MLLLILAYSVFFKRIKNIGVEIGSQGIKFNSLFKIKSLAWSYISEIIKTGESRAFLAERVSKEHYHSEKRWSLRIVAKDIDNNIEIDLYELKDHETFLAKLKEYYKNEIVERS
jgi:hypothetical protein